MGLIVLKYRVGALGSHVQERPVLQERQYTGNRQCRWGGVYRDREKSGVGTQRVARVLQGKASEASPGPWRSEKARVTGLL